MSQAVFLLMVFLSSVFQRPESYVRKLRMLKNLGVKIETDVIIGKSVTIDELMEEEGFKAVFIGSGAGLPKFHGYPGGRTQTAYYPQTSI